MSPSCGTPGCRLSDEVSQDEALARCESDTTMYDAEASGARCCGGVRVGICTARDQLPLLVTASHLGTVAPCTTSALDAH